MKIELELPTRLARVLVFAVPACILCTAAGAYAQSTQAAATTDTLVGSALSTLGNAVTTLRAEVAVLQMGERVARAALTPAGAVATQTGSWIAKVDHPSPGTYIVSFSPGVFAAVPTCVTSAQTTQANELALPSVQCREATPRSITCKAMGLVSGAGSGGASVAPVDTGISLICAGS